MHSRVYTNRTLNLRKIKYIGFDMDHTLVRYYTEAFETLAYHQMLIKLVEEKGYPADVRNLTFTIDGAIRGLVIDSARGNLLKVSRHGAIRASRHGTKPIDFQEQKKTYLGTYVDLGSSEFSSIDTAFSLSVAVLYSQLVDMRDQRPLEFPDYHKILADIIEVMDMSHRDDSLKSVVRSDLKKYIVQDPAVAKGLERYKKHSKNIFILTNSDFHYTNALLKFAIDPFLTEHKSWMDLFDYTITLARKPRFFFDNVDFLKVNPADGTLTNYDQPLVPGVYQGGCAKLFEKNLAVTGDDILYIGDHIYGDIVRLKKDCRWRTALVVEELDQEISQISAAIKIQNAINDLMTKKVPLEYALVELVSQEIERGEKKSDEILQRQQEISELDQQISPLIKKMEAIFNPNWGEVMRSGNEESYFAHQVDRFADIYMPQLADLLKVSPRSYFRSLRRPLAHEQSQSLVFYQP